MDKWAPTIEEQMRKQLVDDSFTMAVNTGMGVKSSPTISNEALSQLVARVETTNAADSAILRLVIERLSL